MVESFKSMEFLFVRKMFEAEFYGTNRNV